MIEILSNNFIGQLEPFALHIRGDYSRGLVQHVMKHKRITVNTVNCWMVNLLWECESTLGSYFAIDSRQFQLVYE